MRTKCPLASVMVPLVVPFSRTVAPMMGSPAGSVTVPLTLTLWAKRLTEVRTKVDERSNRRSEVSTLCTVSIIDM